MKLLEIERITCYGTVAMILVSIPLSFRVLKTRFPCHVGGFDVHALRCICVLGGAYTMRSVYQPMKFSERYENLADESLKVHIKNDGESMRHDLRKLRLKRLALEEVTPPMYVFAMKVIDFFIYG